MKRGFSSQELCHIELLPNFGTTSGVDLVDVRHGAVVNTISFSTIAADDVEISFCAELGASFSEGAAREPRKAQNSVLGLTEIARSG
jgi:hypothetical protein